MSIEQKRYLKKIKTNKIIVLVIQILIVSLFLITWEILANKKIINSFIFSMPSKIITTIIKLINEQVLWYHLLTTLKEIFIGFISGIIIGFILAILLYEFNILAKVLEPFLTMINSLPKVALGPLIILLFGANTKSIIIMALLINLIINIMTIYNGFLDTDPLKIKLLKSFGANKKQLLFKLIIPSSYGNIISSLKINISMTLIGVIMGEFLVSKAGIGYLIIYGTQVFNLNLVMASIFILIILSLIIYNLVSLLERISYKK